MDLYQAENLMAVIRNVHSQHADDLCWLDIDRIFLAAGLPVPDRRVGCKIAMKKNCDRFIDVMCIEGKWKSYAELEAEIVALKQQLTDSKEHTEDLAGIIEELKDKLGRG